MTICVIAACVLIFLGLNHLGVNNPRANPLYADTSKFGYFPVSAVWEGKPWALITWAFVHFEIWHIFFNLYALWILGGNIERDIGPLRYTIFIVVAAWFSSSAQLATGHTGIGLSGVIYALFGFAWIGRHNLPNTRPYMHQGTINQMLGWLVLCVIFTALKWMHIGNAAHFGGLIFGVIIGAIAYNQRKRILLVPALALLLAASFVPLFWCPLSPDWTAHAAETARDLKDYPRTGTGH